MTEAKGDSPGRQMDKPLDGVRIIDLSNMLMTPYTTQILGDMGADVIKVEAPEGDPVRDIGPLRHKGMGAIFLNANRSKRSIVLDLKRQEGHAAMMKLLETADILIYNRRPQVMERLGLSYEAVRKVNPEIIYAGMYGYGQNGPYASKPAFDDLIQGAAAIPLLGRTEGEKPRYVPVALVDRGVGLWAVGQVNAALFHRARTDKGQRIDMPMFEMMASMVLSDHLSGETFEPAIGPTGYQRLLSPERRPYETQDGWICVLVYTDRHWQAFFSAIGREADYRSDPRFASMTTRTENIDAIYRELAVILLTRTTKEWLDFFDTIDVPAMPLNTAESLLSDPHLEAVGFFSVADHPSEGRLRTMAFPSIWSETQPAPSHFAPRLGEHNAEILSELGYSKGEIADLSTAA